MTNDEYELAVNDITFKAPDNDVNTRALLLIAAVLWEIRQFLVYK